MTRDVLRQRSAEHFTSRPLCAPREALDFLKHLVGNRHRCFHTVSITAAESHKNPGQQLTGFFCGQNVDNRRARLCTATNESACSCTRPSRAVQTAYGVPAQPDEVPHSGLVGNAEVLTSSLLPSTSFLSKRERSHQIT